MLSIQVQWQAGKQMADKAKSPGEGAQVNILSTLLSVVVS